jgi:ABC-type dipeptide/oligopeptide/nickel transport system permease component
VEILTNDYIRTARAKGLSELLVNRRHVWRNALILVLRPDIPVQLSSYVNFPALLTLARELREL